MIEKLIKKWNVNISKSFMIGDQNLKRFISSKKVVFILNMQRKNLLNQVKEIYKK